MGNQIKQVLAAAPVQPSTDMLDARRYRWLRECIRRWGSVPQSVLKPAGGAKTCATNELDAAIDAAMLSAKETK